MKSKTIDRIVNQSIRTAMTKFCMESGVRIPFRYGIGAVAADARDLALLKLFGGSYTDSPRGTRNSRKKARKRLNEIARYCEGVDYNVSVNGRQIDFAKFGIRKIIRDKCRILHLN